ncbi:hypothetical protein SAMN02745116_01652 [Pilibacter termitis]|uniref:Uncharacterized protein n=1 Tax=Pilibacter termitis TaxID=263852 RepID=A0A1T4P4L4_9ENTE|nr:hypothetical protein [Pilibacter termitis]SJZ86454.1 hypothetical protein SAMN02745116_01652 [Pilibacter termitis]
MKQKRIKIQQNFTTVARELFFRLISLEEVDEVKLDEVTSTVSVISRKNISYHKIREILQEMSLATKTTLVFF